MEQKNWNDVLTGALTDPFLHHCAKLERHIGREAALCSAVIALSEDRQRLQDRLQRLLEEAPSHVEYRRIASVIGG